MVACMAVDWGTTNRRLFHIDAAGVVIARDSDDRGILSVGDFPAEIAALAVRAAGAPLLLAGMVGSNRGWVDVPYAMAPAGLAAIVAGLVQPLPQVFIVPGVRFDDPARPDILRGEEMQFLGALALGLLGDGLACFPGTHSKWLEIADGAITRFRTIMTGDILAALKARSILSDLLDHEPGIDQAFIDGVDHGLDTPDLIAELFTVRARVVTGGLAPADAASRISGLLIGTDVRIGLGRLRADVVPVIGTPALTARFALALSRAGREAVVIDGETAFVAGAAAIAAHLPESLP